VATVGLDRASDPNVGWAWPVQAEAALRSLAAVSWRVRSRGYSSAVSVAGSR
jgi:hypothetical protein